MTRLADRPCNVCGGSPTQLVRERLPGSQGRMAQRVYVGKECLQHIAYWHTRGGYQPPSGGPKLFLSTLFRREERS